MNTEKLTARAILVAEAGTVCVVFWLLFRTFYGDPTIYLSYAKNAARGLPFTFNPGQFSSGSTSPIWPLVLAPAYVFGSHAWSQAVVKIIACAALLGALAAYYGAARSVSDSPAGAAASAAILVYFVAPQSAVLYEAPLSVVFISLTLYAAWLLLSDDGYNSRNLFLLGLASAGLVLSRPETAIIAAVSVVVVLIFRARTAKERIDMLKFTLPATLPAVAYYGYSLLSTGYVSSSAYGRRLAMSEMPALGGRNWSSALPALYVALPLALIAPFAVAGIVMLIRDKKVASRAMAAILLGALAALMALYIWVVPLGPQYAERYSLPAVVVTCFAGAAGLGWLVRRAQAVGLAQLAVLVGAVGLAVMPLKWSIDSAKALANPEFRFGTIVEGKLAQHLNRSAPRRASILIYEVQDRFYLRDDLDVISLDGIVDAKVFPYAARSDMVGFLRKYRPTYWVINDAVFYRPFLAKSMLRPAAEQILAGRSEVSQGGIRFRLVRLNPHAPPKGLAGWRAVTMISFDP